MISKALTESVLACAMSSGADFAELYGELTKNNTVSMVDGKIDRAVENLISGVGVVAAALIIFAAIMAKKGLGFAIFAGLFQIVGSFATQKMVHIMVGKGIILRETVYGSSMEDAQNKADAIMSEWLGDVAIPFMICSVLFLASWIIGILVLIKAMKASPKILPILGLVVHILRYTIIAPYDMFAPITNSMSEAVQKSADTRYYIFTLIPFVLVALGSIFYRLKTNKQAALAAAEAAAEVAAEPAVEAVAEAPAEEAAEAPAEEAAEAPAETNE